MQLLVLGLDVHGEDGVPFADTLEVKVQMLNGRVLAHPRAHQLHQLRPFRFGILPPRRRPDPPLFHPCLLKIVIPRAGLLAEASTPVESAFFSEQHSFNTPTALHPTAWPHRSPTRPLRMPGTPPRAPHPPASQSAQQGSLLSAPTASPRLSLLQRFRRPAPSPPTTGKCNSRESSHARDPAPSLWSAWSRRPSTHSTPRDPSVRLIPGSSPR